MKREARGKRPQFYDSPALDQMMSMILVLAGEVSVLADEIDSIKRVASQRGLDLAAEIRNLKLDEAALEEREGRRQQMLERLFYLIRKEAAEAAGNETPESFNAVIEEIAQR